MDYSNVKIEVMDYSGSEKRWLLTTMSNRYIIKNNLGLKIKKLLESDDKEAFLSVLSEQEKSVINKLFNEEQHGKRRSGMWFKFTILNQKVINKLGIFSFLFNKWICFFIIALFIATFLYAVIATNSLNYYGLDIKNLTGSSYVKAAAFGVLGIFFHELGHITASIMYGAVPKSLGVGMYFMSPVVYVDVDDSWKLKRKERVIVDIGGVYFQTIYALLLLIVYLFSNSSVSIILYFMLVTSLIFNLNPFLKYDGYWFLSDLLGIYNLNKKFPIVIRACIQYAVGKKSLFKSLRLVWSKNVLLTIFGYGVISIIFYIFFSYKIFIYIISNIINISNINALKLMITIFFIFIGIKSIIALIKLIMQVFISKDETM